MSDFNYKLHDALERQKTMLKTCPFCGGEAKIMDLGYPHWVYCENCGAKVHGGTHDEKDSVEAWNRQSPL